MLALSSRLLRPQRELNLPGIVEENSDSAAPSPVLSAASESVQSARVEEVSVSLQSSESETLALAEALRGATAAGRWDVVAVLAEELKARRVAAAGNVVSLSTRKGGAR
jgi:hypothetical protein